MVHSLLVYIVLTQALDGVPSWIIGDVTAGNHFTTIYQEIFEDIKFCCFLGFHYSLEIISLKSYYSIKSCESSRSLKFNSRNLLWRVNL